MLTNVIAGAYLRQSLLYHEVVSTQTLYAKLENGHLVLEEPISFPEGVRFRLELTVESVTPDLDRRRKLLREVADEMAHESLAATAPPLTREELHSR